MATAVQHDAAFAAAGVDGAPAGDDRPLLRFVTCGSVDDGKSTLIGRLLHDAGALFADQVEALSRDSRRFGTRGDEPDYALLVDGLAAEREQGITIDVAYRYFAGPRRRYIVADSPGHEQYTRNMATAASTADLAVLLVDATRGLTAQTRRHARIVRMLGVATVVVAVNKMDRVGHDRARFDAIVADFTELAAAEGIAGFTAVPVVAVSGGNIAQGSPAMPWYRGPTLLDLLEEAPVADRAAAGGFVLPVQWVSRPDETFRGVAGTVARGSVRPGDAVAVLPGGEVARVARLVTFDGDFDAAAAGRAITLVLDREVDCAAGAVLVAADDRPVAGTALTADLVWFDAQPMAIGRRYLIQLAATRASAEVVAIEGRLDEADAGGALAMNGLARVRLRVDTPIVALPYADNRDLGAFVLIDRATNATAAAGMVRSVGDDEAAAPSPAPIYRFEEDDPGAAAMVASMRRGGTPAVLLDRETLRAGIAADLPEDALAGRWRRAMATAALFAETGVVVALAIEPPADAPPFGRRWGGAADPGDWVI